MTGTDPEPPPRYDPIAALKQPNFLLYLSSRLFSAVASTLLQAALLWHVYDISGSALNLGLLGLARFFPALGLSLVGGAVADVYNRRTVIMIAQVVPALVGAVLAYATIDGWVSLELIYAGTLIAGLAAAFESPATAALLPAIVRRETFAQAVTVSTSVRSLGAITGPALAGGVISVAGGDVGPAYVVYSLSLVCSLVVLAFLRYRHAAAEVRRGVSIAAIAEAVRFVRQRQVLLGAMSLDLFAVIFGGARALLPIYATDILDVGSAGYGILQGGYELGAFLMAGVMVVRPPVVRVGRALIWAVVAFGALTILFGLSRIFAVSVFLYLSIGAVDQLSVVMRHAIIQLATPDELRGRVSSVSQIFIQSSNQLNAIESGFMAALTSATFAVVTGGAAAIAVTGLIFKKLPALYQYSISYGRAEGDEAGAEPPEPAVASGGSAGGGS